MTTQTQDSEYAHMHLTSASQLVQDARLATAAAMLHQVDPSPYNREQTSSALLSALGAGREAAAELADAEVQLVAAARAAGALWGEIGTALGVSPQAAHKRYA